MTGGRSHGSRHGGDRTGRPGSQVVVWTLSMKRSLFGPFLTHHALRHVWIVGRIVGCHLFGPVLRRVDMVDMAAGAGGTFNQCGGTDHRCGL